MAESKKSGGGSRRSALDLVAQLRSQMKDEFPDAFRREILDAHLDTAEMNIEHLYDERERAGA